MKAQRTFLPLFAFAIAQLLNSQAAHAAGYEKSVFWSGRFSGVAGAATSSVIGAESLYFNPAGLAGSKATHEIAANFSPTWSNFEGPIGEDFAQKESETGFSPVYSLIYGGKLSEDFGFAIGGYTAAGTKVKYENVAFANTLITPDVKTELAVHEIGIGAGYRVMEGLSVGASWRIDIAEAEFASATYSSTTNVLQAIELRDLKDTQYSGFRLGAQYAPSENWGLGLAARTEVQFKAEGTSGGQIARATAGDLTGDKVTVETVLPWQVALGGHYDIVPKEWRAYAEYVWTQYSRAKVLTIDGTVTVPAGIIGASAVTSAIPNIDQQWKDQHNIRLAGEYMGAAWPIRFGYVFTSQVTPEGYARASFVAPGPAHTLTVGTGHKFLEDKMQFDVGGEYTRSTGDVDTPAQASTYRGDYSTTGYVLHTGLSYYF